MRKRTRRIAAYATQEYCSRLKTRHSDPGKGRPSCFLRPFASTKELGLGSIRSSYEFHRKLESPVAFVSREWKAIAVFGGAFITVLLVAIVSVDPAFFYSRLYDDPLLYFLKGMSVVEHGTTAAVTAVNTPPFAYAPMPGVLRAPFLYAFRDFDHQLRGIQLMNLALVGLIAVLYAYILSWTQPVRRHWMTVGFSFAFILLSPIWVANVFFPLADAPYAALAITALVLSARVLCSARPLRRQWPATAVWVALFVVAFLVRYTAPVLLVYAAVLALGRGTESRGDRRLRALLVVAPLVGLAVLAALNYYAISGRYIPDMRFFLQNSDASDMMLNLLAARIPMQIIPFFHFGFARPPLLDIARPVFATTPADASLAVLGALISATMFFGMWKSRHRFAPELAYFLVPLPVLAIMIPSTARYLMSYQPMIWIFLYAGVVVLLRPVARRVPEIRLGPGAVMAILVAAACGFIYMRSTRMLGAEAPPGSRVSIGDTRGYLDEVAAPFRDLRAFLETLPRNRTLLIGERATVGRWKAIAGLNYYALDSGVTAAAAKADVYVLIECGRIEVCQDFPRWEKESTDRVSRFGVFRFDSVFAAVSRHAQTKVYKIRPVPNSTAQ